MVVLRANRSSDFIRQKNCKLVVFLCSECFLTSCYSQYTLYSIFIYSFCFYLFFIFALKTLNWLLSMANRATNALTKDTNAWQIPTCIVSSCIVQILNALVQLNYQLRNKVVVCILQEINAYDLSIATAYLQLFHRLWWILRCRM